MSVDVETQVVLGNAVELALRINQELINNVLPDVVGEANLTEEVLMSLIETRVQHKLQDYLGGV